MAISHVVLVGGDKGGTGKTTVSRALLSYLGQKGVEFRAFDTECPIGVLQRFHPDKTKIVDLTVSDGQMEVFDQLNKLPVTVIDIRAGLLSPTLQCLSDIGLLEGVQRGAYKLTLLHIIGSSIASFREIASMKLMAAGARHIITMSHINGASFFDWQKEVRDTASSENGTLQINQLDELAYEHIDHLGLPFNAFCTDETQSLVLRGKTRKWLLQTYDQFDRVLAV